MYYKYKIKEQTKQKQKSTKQNKTRTEKEAGANYTIASNHQNSGQKVGWLQNVIVMNGYLTMVSRWYEDNFDGMMIIWMKILWMTMFQ